MLTTGCSGTTTEATDQHFVTQIYSSGTFSRKLSVNSAIVVTGPSSGHYTADIDGQRIR